MVMSTFLGPVVISEIKDKSTNFKLNNHLSSKRNRLHSKENTNFYKSRRALKKKLKKYKLRHDGQEDPEVLDVSKILVTSLKIKSPKNNRLTCNHGEIEFEQELRPKNYLFKMGRGKRVICNKDGSHSCAKDLETMEKSSTSFTFHNSEDKAVNVMDTYKKICEKKSDSGSLITKDRKQTNAFMLMMDARNKSIGTNSPGKDKVIDELELQDAIEKRSLKAKRNLLLQKMAETKGALKNKESDEYQEKCVKKKMAKRAERLKNMICGNDSTNSEEQQTKKESSSNGLPKKDSSNINRQPPANRNTLKLVNIFENSTKSQNINDSHRENITKEDNEFLKKLSPSIKKKENMLCYFKKVEKEDDIFIEDVEESNTVIKVKLIKKKTKKTKLSLNKDVVLDGELQRKTENRSRCEGDDTLNVTSNNNKKLTYLDHVENMHFTKKRDCKESIEKDDVRPRRNVKRPAKYIDDVAISSSDEDLHIFTPKKKKKHVEQKHNSDSKSNCLSSDKVSKEILKTCVDKDKPRKNITIVKETSSTKKHTKLAPIFATKPQLDPAAIVAKQKFLSSGVPEILKKNIEQQASRGNTTSSFQTVVHVLQNQTMYSHNIVHKIDSVYTDSESDEDVTELCYKKEFFKSIILSKNNTVEVCDLSGFKQKTHEILQSIKQLYPKFPVYRTFRLLKEKNRGEFKDCSYLDLDNSIEVINGMIDLTNGSPDKLSWTDKYKALSSKQIIGNFNSSKELKKWLISWTENDKKSKKNNNASASDSSDFYQSDTDSTDAMKCINNLLVLMGPVGSGKTSLVYAVAAELAIKVLEVNASSKRTGKIMLQDLQEATQSHKVNRTKTSQDNSQKSQVVIEENIETKGKKRGRPKKSIKKPTKKQDKIIISKNEVLSQPSSQDCGGTCMSLILIDDADIVFDQDDGFCSAIVQLAQCSKRPVILITSSDSCSHLQRFIQCAKIIHTRPFFPRMLGTWLDIMCLADNGTCWPGLGAKCLDHFYGDIRKTINFLQFYAAKDNTLHSKPDSQNIDEFKANIEDEYSNLSWTDREVVDEKNENPKQSLMINEKTWQYIMGGQASMLFLKNPMHLFNIWWNIPRILILPLDSRNKPDRNIVTDNSSAKTRNSLELDVISNVADIMSIADCFCPLNNRERELSSVPWLRYESDSVSELESFDKYDKNREIIDDISHSIVTRSIMNAQKVLDLDTKHDLQFPGMTMKREWDKVSSLHNNLSTYLNPSAALDRRALALDYWSTCRSICRIEKTKTDSNFKRHNRFYHYLKSVNILCKSENLENLGNSFHCTDSSDR